jgi:hypothetical protein
MDFDYLISSMAKILYFVRKFMSKINSLIIDRAEQEKIIKEGQIKRIILKRLKF